MRAPLTSVSRDKDVRVLALLTAGRYRVEPDGTVLDTNWRLTGQTRRVKARQSPSGHWLVNLATGGAPRQMTVLLSRLVALAIHGDPGMPLGVFHLDGNRDNNQPENLAWANGFETMQAASAAGRLNIQRGATHKNAKLDESMAQALKAAQARGLTPVHALRTLGLVGKVSRAAARQVYAGKSWKHVKP